MRAFVPFFKNPHLGTIAANYWRRPADPRRFPTEVKFYDTEPGVRVLVHSQRPASPPAGEVIVIHGLEGSSQSGYAQSLAYELLQAGWAAHRFNLRSCGGTEHLSGRSLYHSGQTSDLLAVLHQIKGSAPIFLVGFSLGGNVVLKLAGELGERASELITGVIAISTPIDLAACAKRLNRPSNFIYAKRFLARLKQRIRIKSESAPDLFALEHLDTVKTVYEFDDKFTAPSFGFGTADNYYATQSSNQFLDRIQVPALLVHAKDDPLVPFEMYNHPAFTRNPNLTLLAVEHGGHVGFISKTTPRFWLDHVILEWMSEVRNKAAPNFVS